MTLEDLRQKLQTPFFYNLFLKFLTILKGNSIFALQIDTVEFANIFISRPLRVDSMLLGFVV